MLLKNPRGNRLAAAECEWRCSCPEEVLSNGRVYDHEPSVSTDGLSIGYVSDRIGRNELWILRLRTKNLDRVELPGRDLAVQGPYWFPDGKRLTVVRTLPDQRNSAWIVAAHGSYAEELPILSFISPSGGGFPVSPDGRIVTYSMRSGSNFQVFGFNIVTRQTHQFTSSPDDRYSGSWSPDRRWLVYVPQTRVVVFSSGKCQPAEVSRNSSPKARTGSVMVGCLPARRLGYHFEAPTVQTSLLATAEFLTRVES
jgi:Tol biopolymer transport system component